MFERFWSKVEKTNGCWNWVAGTSNGYGIFWFNKTYVGAHRISYQLKYGIIPNDKVLDHLCRNPLCVNPDHLELVTDKENVLRGAGPCAQNARKTHCKRGHEFTLENTYYDKIGRHCKNCHIETTRRWWANRSETQRNAKKEYMRNWQEKNREHINEYQRRRYQRS